MVFSEEEKILIKKLRQLKGYTSTRFLREFETKNWTRRGLDYLLAKIDSSGSVDRGLAVVVPALLVLLATSPLSKK